MKLTKKSETATKITFTYDRPPGPVEGYLYYAGGVAVSRTFNPNDLEVTFGKVPSGQYAVEAVGFSIIARADWPEAAPPPVGTPQNFKAGDPTETTVPLSWDAVAGASSYKLAMIPAGGTTVYASVTALEKTWSGLTPNTSYEFDIQTVMPDNTTSDWHGRITAKTDAGTTPPPSGGFKFALGSSGDENRSATIAQSLGVKLSRSYDHGPGSSVASIQSACQVYQSRGVRPFILCNWGNGTDVEAVTPGLIPDWAAAVGPNGTWYQQHPEWASLAVTHIEMGNEWFYNYRGGINQAKCQQYARAFRDTAVAVKAKNPNVGLLFMTDIDNQGTTPYNNMVDWFYQAVPNIHDYMAGVTFHIYGPPGGSNVFPKMQDVLNRMASHGAPNTIKIWVTEDGVASDNGRNLTDNYGWPTNQTYAQAGAALRQKLSAVLGHATIGPRMAVWTNYQAHDQQPTGTTNEREAYFGVVQSNQAAKGDITQSVRDHAQQYPGP